MVELKNFNFTYALACGAPALKNINLQVREGEFLTLCGASGSGKSTLLRCLKKSITPAGDSTGSIVSCEEKDIAIVFQNPETQSVMADVISDLAFQMENRGLAPGLMRKRMSEAVSFFGLEALLHKPVWELSGGQKQLTALCAALMCEPRLLLLDEPVSQLDPLAEADFLSAAQKLNREFGVTVVMAEHRLDDCAAITDRVAFMQGGEIKFAGETQDALKFLYVNGYKDYVPALPQVSLAVNGSVRLTPREFREGFEEVNIIIPPEKETPPHNNFSVKLTDVTAGYAGKKAPVLNRLNFTAGQGETVCLTGGNGSGKSTLLKVVAGVIKPFTGKARVNGKTAYMPQNIRNFFLYDTVRQNIADLNEISALAEELNIMTLLDRNPADLSGGEQQKCALCAMLSRKPGVLLLDEPTKGMDAGAKKTLGRALKNFAAQGGASVIATHDTEFAARWADACAMLFDGAIAYEGRARAFFTGSKYYTTAVHKALRHVNPRVLLPEDITHDVSPTP